MTDLMNGTPTEYPPTDLREELAASVNAPTLQAPASAVVADERSGPSLSGPASALAADGITASTWRSGTVTALWSNDEARNAWMLVSGIGWRKLLNARDGAFVALVTLASQARQTGRTIQFREEADGMVYEIYLW